MAGYACNALSHSNCVSFYYNTYEYGRGPGAPLNNMSTLKSVQPCGAICSKHLVMLFFFLSEQMRKPAALNPVSFLIACVSEVIHTSSPSRGPVYASFTMQPCLLQNTYTLPIMFFQGKKLLPGLHLLPRFFLVTEV